MSNIFDFLGKFFNNNTPKKESKPFLHESIDLKSISHEEILKWTRVGRYEEFKELVQKAFRDYYIKGENQSNLDAVTVLSKSHHFGWYLHANTLQFVDSDYKYLAFYMNYVLKNHGYTTQVAEVKSISTSSGVEAFTHIYLKPSLKNYMVKQGELINQLYGNVTIEYKTINGEPLSFKFLVKPYSDSKYQDPLDFDDLNPILFG